VPSKNRARKVQEAGAKTADVCREHGISDVTFYKWKSKYGGMEASDAKRLKALEDENAKLKRLLAEAMLDNAMLKDIASKKWWRPGLFGKPCLTFVRSIRSASAGACRVLNADRSSIRHKSVRPPDDAIRKRLRELAGGAMSDVFISYSNKDRALAAKVAADLEAIGYSVWWYYNLIGGRSFRKQIIEKLNAARAVIVIWAYNSVSSEFVLHRASPAPLPHSLFVDAVAPCKFRDRSFRSL
jgi:putative transposase